MSNEVAVALIGLAGIVAAGLFRILSKLGGIHSEMNSRLTELLRVTREAARADGVVEGTTLERQRVRDAREQRAADTVADVSAASLAEDTAAARAMPPKE